MPMLSKSLVDSQREKLPRIEHPSRRKDSTDLSSLGVRGTSRNSSLIERAPEKRSFLPSFDEREESSRTNRIRLDELESTLRDKVRSNLVEVKSKFRHSSEPSRSALDRSALKHFIRSILGKQRQISDREIEQLIDRLSLSRLEWISFDKFVESLLDDRSTLDRWFNKQILSSRDDSQRTTRQKPTSEQMFSLLRDKVERGDERLAQLIPCLVDGRPSRLFKAQLRNDLIELGIASDDHEFDKFWEKFDTDGFKAVSSEKMLKILFKDRPEEEERRSRSLSKQSTQSRQSQDESRLPSSRSSSDEESFRRWVKHKFPQGLTQLESSLERLDKKQNGLLPQDEFLAQLNKFGVRMEKDLFVFFLKKLEIDLGLTNGLVPYRDVVNVLKENSDPTRKRLNIDNKTVKNEGRQFYLERQIDYSISMNYPRVKSLFHRFDPSNKGTVEGNQLRTIVEDLLSFTFKPDEFYSFLKRVPTDEQGLILYKVFLKQVLDRCIESSSEKDSSMFKRVDRWDLIESSQQPSMVRRDEIRSKLESNEKMDDEATSFVNPSSIRSFDELKRILKQFIRQQFKSIEQQFKQIDRSSYGELNKDLLYQLVKSAPVDPKISREEIDLIWSHCHMKENGRLDFYQFIREFGYTKGSAHFPNAKSNPPKRGDADFLLTSRKLYGDSVLVRGTALNAIKSNWNQLRQEFVELDPHRTGFLQSDEFDEILVELCPSVNQDDLIELRQKFHKENESKMNYLLFLKHYAPYVELNSLIDQNYRHSTIEQHSGRSSSKNSLLHQVHIKIQRKLTDHLKQVRRAFKGKDPSNSGQVDIATFKQVLQQFQCQLTDEQFYTLVSQLDTNVNGTINYNYFIQNYVKST